MEKSKWSSEKRNKIIYWIFTLWLSLGMVSTGIVQLMQTKEETDMFNHLGFPLYLLTILGVCKLLGVIAVLIPRFPLLKEWTYAGFFFTMSGAVVSHLIMKDPMNEVFPPLLLVFLTMISWYFRPDGRKIIPVKYHE
jgi:uncharacterized membrane protein YphA (DoxX/SURF4 family)